MAKRKLKWQNASLNGKTRAKMAKRKLRALRAWRPCGPVTTTHHLKYYPFGWIRKLFPPLFLLFDSFAYDTFSLKIHLPVSLSVHHSVVQFFELWKLSRNCMESLNVKMTTNDYK